MNRSRPRPSRQIRGPQSALTDFLASHNIDANQIRLDATARRAAAASAPEAEEQDAATSSAIGATGSNVSRRKHETKEQQKKRKKEEEKAIADIKASKSKRLRGSENSDGEGSNEKNDNENDSRGDRLSFLGQMTNCEMCRTRFFVTAYSRSCPDKEVSTDAMEGLLCPKCSREMDTEDRTRKKQRKKLSGAARRQNASNILDGIYPGTKSLVTLCVETLANNVHEAESLGSLPLELVKKVSAILSKRRLITSPILDLFLEQKHDTLIITDAAKLISEDYCRIFQIVPNIKHLKLRNAIQFKNRVMEFLLGTTIDLISFDIHGANLIDDERWEQFLRQKGPKLRTLKVHYTDNYFGDKALENIALYCNKLQRLKISHNSKVSNEGLKYIAALGQLEHISLELYRVQGTAEVCSKPLVQILISIGSRLQTFSIESVRMINDTVLEAIHKNCVALQKLRITESEKLSDEGFCLLFKNWVNPPLRYINLSGCRHVDAVQPRENEENVGLCSAGFEALMSHSGSQLEYLDITGCRHISRDIFEAIFGTEKRYESLEHIDVSFCSGVSDFVVGCIFRSCPRLKVLTVFGCIGVKEVRVPRGKVLIGMANALGMQIEGTEDCESN